VNCYYQGLTDPIKSPPVDVTHMPRTKEHEE
jgi:hypothetical protein